MSVKVKIYNKQEARKLKTALMDILSPFFKKEDIPNATLRKEPPFYKKLQRNM